MSVLVLVAGALFVAMPPQTGIAFAVSGSSLQGKHSVIYGAVVDRHRDPVPHARVKLVRWADGERHVVRSKRTNRRGVFRFELFHPKKDNYKVRVFKAKRGPNYFGVRRIKVRPGTAFEVKARLVRSGNVFFLPISTY